jgi:hypothetical protein
MVSSIAWAIPVLWGLWFLGLAGQENQASFAGQVMAPSPSRLPVMPIDTKAPGLAFIRL